MLLLPNSAKFVVLKFVIMFNMSHFRKIGFLRSAAKFTRETCLKVVAAIEDATGKGLGGPRHKMSVGLVRTSHKRKQEIYIKGISLLFMIHINPQPGYTSTTCAFTNTNK